MNTVTIYVAPLLIWFAWAMLTFGLVSLWSLVAVSSYWAWQNRAFWGGMSTMFWAGVASGYTYLFFPSIAFLWRMAINSKGVLL